MKMLSLLLLLSVSVTAAALPNLTLCAQYSVWLPVDQRDLEPLNTFMVPSYLIDRSVEGSERMIFDLPLDLTAGVATPIVLTVIQKIGDERQFSGEVGSAVCKGPWETMTCNFDFNNFDGDRQALTDFLIAKYGNSERTLKIAKIAGRFFDDPVGVAVVGIPERNCR